MHTSAICYVVFMLMVGSSWSSSPNYAFLRNSLRVHRYPLSSRMRVRPSPTLIQQLDSSFHRRSRQCVPLLKSSLSSVQLDVPINGDINNNASTIFDAIVNARYACTRFHRHQEPSDDDQILDIVKNGGINNNNTISNKMSGSGNGSGNNITTITLSNSRAIQPSRVEEPRASISNSQIIQMAYQSLILAQRAPSGFNAQPYRIILVHSQKDKETVAQYCLGRNADRVRDSDCTAVFLADEEIGWEGQRYKDLLEKSIIPTHKKRRGGDSNPSLNDWNITTTTNTNLSLGQTDNTIRSRRSLSPRELLKVKLLILLFSSGYPLPSIISIPLSFFVRLGVSILAAIMRQLHSIQQYLLQRRRSYNTNNTNQLECSIILSRWLRLLSSFITSRLRKVQLLPTLYPSNTWSQKNTMLVAMTYILSCTSHGLATCPMEGIDARGIKKVLGVSPMGRYSIPLIVSTGLPYHRTSIAHDDERDRKEEEKKTATTTTKKDNDVEIMETDDAGLSHGRGSMLSSPRYPSEEVIYENIFGIPFAMGTTR